MGRVVIDRIERVGPTYVSGVDAHVNHLGLRAVLLRVIPDYVVRRADQHVDHRRTEGAVVLAIDEEGQARTTDDSRERCSA